MIELTVIEKLDTDTFKQIYKEKGEHWLITALVEGSIGYHTPDHAKRIIKRALEGATKETCERCAACYNSDLLLMLAHDIRGLAYTETEYPAQFKRIIEAIKQISQLDEQHQSTISLLYPTLGI